MPFENIINQQHVVNFLLSSYRSNRIAGAYLFIGKEGVGTEQTAKEFARLINCENTDSGICNNCPPCRKINQEAHVDIHWYRPVNNSIVISQVRDIGKYMYLKPFEAKKIFFIICQAQCLTEESSNALLKTLEEPSPDSVIILIVSDTTELLPTIISRCQKIIFNSIDESQIKDILIKEYNTPLMHAHFISYFANGSLDRAISFKDLKDGLLEKRNHILNAVYFKKFSMFRMQEFSIKDNTEKRKSINLLLDILLTWFRDLLIIKSNLSAAIINLDKKEELIKLKDSYSRQELINSIANISNTKLLINSNLNVKLSMSKLRADLWK